MRDTGRVTIHSEHPFLPPDKDRDPVRRFRGHMPAPVTVWTTGAESLREGWTVSSLMIADGQPARLVGLMDEDADFVDRLRETGVFVVNLLTAEHRLLADAFARVGPAPGGPFTLGSWSTSEWGPVLDDAAGWLGARWNGVEASLGWPMLIEAEIEHAEVSGTSPAPMMHLRGRYEDPQ
ncbi:MAG: flavin reductase [Nocardioidaceae bacterium]|nr:flavin reductase [Nocardioidaceae bacterium]